MPEDSFQNLVAVNGLPDLLICQIRKFATLLVEQGYAEETVRLKLQLVTKLWPVVETKRARHRKA